MGLLDLLGAMSNSNRVGGGIQTMPDGSFSFSPMTVNRPGWDMVTGGRGTARANAYNDSVMSALLQQQMLGKQRLAEIKASADEGRTTNQQMAGFNTEIARLAGEINRAQATLQATLNRQNELARIEATGGQNRETAAQAAKLNKEIMQLQADINDKSQILQQNLQEASKMGVMPRGESDLNELAGTINTTAAANALAGNRNRLKVMTSPEGEKAYKQGVVATMQKPAVDNVVNSRFLIPPANIATMPGMDESGLIDIPGVTGRQFGLTPFAEQSQPMMTLPSGQQYPVGERLQTSGYRVPVAPVPRPEQFKRPVRTPGNASISTMPDAGMPADSQPNLGNMLFGGGGFTTGSPNTSFYGGMPTMPDAATYGDYSSGLSGMPNIDALAAIQRGGRMASDALSNARIPDWLRRVLGWSPNQN